MIEIDFEAIKTELQNESSSTLSDKKLEEVKEKNLKKHKSKSDSDSIENETPEERKRRRAAERRRKRREEAKILKQEKYDNDNIPPRASYLFPRWCEENADQWRIRRNLPPLTKLRNIPEQEQVASKIADILKIKDNVILEAPTGWGKTGLAYQVYKKYSEQGKRVLILNHANVLLGQYIDLLECNLLDESVSLMGKSNYKCFKKPEETVDKCDCHRCRFKKNNSKIEFLEDPTRMETECEYYWRKERSTERDLVISNYHQTFSLINTDPNSFVKYDLMICDECHNIEKILVDYATVIVSESIVTKLEGFILKLKEKDDDIWNNHINKLKNYLIGLKQDVIEIDESNCYTITDHFYKTLSSISDEIDDFYEKDKSSKNEEDSKFWNATGLEIHTQDYIRDLSSAYDLYHAITEMGQQDNYLYEPSRDEQTKTVKLVPLKVNFLFKYYLGFIANKTLLMSATVINPDNLMDDLGLNPDKTEYIELGSKVPTQNRPIYSLNKCKISIKDPDYEYSQDFRDLINTILDILKTHGNLGHSGFIYCNSYKLSNMIYKNLEGLTDYNIYMNKDASGTQMVLQDFLNTDIKKRLLISCSFAEGVNFNDEISRFQIIPKVPYLFLGSKRISTKNIINNRWYTNKTIEQIIQVAGRSVRSETDFATTYILDKTFNNAYERYKEDYPTWFRDAIIKL